MDANGVLGRQRQNAAAAAIVSTMLNDQGTLLVQWKGDRRGDMSAC
jgi:hypothetical protein